MHLDLVVFQKSAADICPDFIPKIHVFPEKKHSVQSNIFQRSQVQPKKIQTPKNLVHVSNKQENKNKQTEKNVGKYFLFALRNFGFFEKIIDFGILGVLGTLSWAGQNFPKNPRFSKNFQGKRFFFEPSSLYFDA